MKETQHRLKLTLDDFEIFIKKYETENFKEVYKPFNSKLFKIYKEKLLLSQKNNIPFEELPNIRYKYRIKADF